MERLAEIIATLSDEVAVAALSDDELTALRTELATIGLALTAGDEASDDPVAAAASAADHFEGVAFVLASRGEARAAQAEALAAQAARFAASDPDPEPEPEEEAPAEPEVPEAVAPVAPVAEITPEPVLEPALAVVPAPAPAPVAPAPVMPALSTITPPAANVPAPVRAESRLVRMPSMEFGSLDELVADTIDRHDAFLGMAGGASEKVVLGRIKFDIPESLEGKNDEAQFNTLSTMLDGAWEPDRWTEALIASGGFCAPGEPDYSIPMLSGTQRPVRDALPTVGMGRGSTIVATPPTLASVVSSTGTTAGSAISVMTNTADIAVTSKPVQTVPCATTQTITLEAIVEQLQFGNSMSRAWPELVKTWYGLAAAAWARRAESELLRQIDAFSLANTTTQVLGATGDFKGYLHQAAAAQRNRHRMPANARLRAFVPAWFIDLVGADLAHQHAGDGLDRYTLGVEGFVRALFGSANVTPTFYEDTAATGATTTQLFGAATGGADLENFPPGPGVTSARMIWYLFPEGTYARGDGGTLDLGIVRDSTLNNTNDYRFFTESWEAVVPHIIESLKITSTICATGAGALDVASSAYCTAS